MPSNSRVVVWFSCGAASAIASALALKKHGGREIVVAYIDTGAEHEDNQRFLADCERWLGVEIVRLQSDTYADTWDVWERTRYLVGPRGARCTTELKKKVRFAFQRPDDLHVFGFTFDEAQRATRFREQNFEIQIDAPLIDSGLGKADCLTLLAGARIELPAMYRMGYRNNNCIGCVKGGAGYWNKIRVDFPEVFDRMAKLERSIGATVTKEKGRRVYLDELTPTAGRYEAIEEQECSPLCSIAADVIAPVEASR